MSRWCLVRSQGHTVYHRRRLASGAWLVVVFRDSGRWEWALRSRHAVHASGECSTWQIARRAADEAAAKLVEAS